jgi:hypothetical protein
MDYPFWIPLGSSLSIGIYSIVLQHRSIALQQRQMGDTTTASGSSARSAWLPSRSLVIMFLLMALCWIPYLLSAVAASDRTTPDNVESKVKLWIDTFHLGSQTLPPGSPLGADVLFGIVVTNHQGRQIMVHRDKSLERYLQFQATIAVTPDDQKKLAALHDADRIAIVRDLQIELSRAGIGFGGIALPLSSFAVMKSVPIDLLNESTFVQNLDQTDLGYILAAQSFRREIDERTTRHSSQ